MSRPRVVWQPGWQTADERREEWFDEHGWATSPPRETLAEWAALQRAEREYCSPTQTDTRGVRSGLGDEVEVDADVPSVLVVPAHPQFGEREGNVAVELFSLDSGQPVLAAFTSVERLVEVLGDYQPWVQMPGSTAVSISNGILLIDPDRDVLQPVWTEGRFNALRGATSD